MKEMKRILALVLCLVMLVGIMPASAFATETGDAQTDITAPTDSAVETTPVETTEASEETEEETTGSAEETEEETTESSEETTEETEEETTEETEEETTEETEEETTEATESDVIAVTGITLDQTELEVGVGAEPVTLVATVLPEDATDKTVTWTSSEPGVAAVEDGILSFGYMGEAVITATAGDFSATCTVTVGEGESDTFDNNTIYVLAGSDFQPLNNNVTNGKTLLANILKVVKKNHSEIDGFLFLGDYSYSGGDSNTNTNNNYVKKGMTAVKETVQASYSNLGTGTNDMIWVQGNHDYNISALSPSGNNDTASYGVFVINENDFPGDNSNAQATVQATAENLDTYLDAKVAAGYTKPIFVVSHLPLHYTYRTASRYDGIYASELVDVLNEGGENGLNIIFLYGHIHSHGYDEYMGGEYVYIPRDGQIAVATSQTKCAYETIDFTYMNAGYVSYYCPIPGNGSGYDTDNALSMTVFEITDNNVTIHRYNNDGEVNLKNAGSFTSKDSTSYGYSINSDVVSSPKTLTLTKDVGQRVVITPVTDLTAAFAGFKVGNDPVTVEVTSNVEDVTYAWVSSNPNVATVTGNGATATIKPLAVGTVTIQVTATPATRATTEPGIYTFDVTVAAENAVVIPGTEAKTIWRPAAELTVGETYLLVSDAESGDGNTRYAVANTSSSTVTAKTVTVQTDSQGEYIETDDKTLMWLAEESPKIGNYSHPYMANSSTGRYLQYQNASTLRTTTKKTQDYTKWRIGGSYDGLYVVQSTSSGDSYRRYMRYSATNKALAMGNSATDTREITAWILTETEASSGSLTVSLSSLYGSVRQNAGTTASTGTSLIIQDAEGNTKRVNVTVGMLRDANGNAVSTANAGSTLSGLRVYYMDTLISENFTLRVLERSSNDYPEYPDPGSVDVDKTADASYLQQTGVVKVELATSGIPVDKGVDVLVVIDTSSSMNESRMSALRVALKDMLIAFNQKDGLGNVPDIQIAIMDFNGYYNSDQGMNYQKGTELSDIGDYWDRTDAAKVYTGVYKNQGTATAWANGAAAFVQNTEFVNTDGSLNTNRFDPADVTVASGTAYDLGLARAYNILASKQAQNKENGEERDSYVIFMSDGAPYGYNGIVTKTEYEVWNDYLLGTYPTLQALEDAVNNKITGTKRFEIAALDNNFGHLYNGQGTGDPTKTTDASGASLHPHRWAEAIKGTPDQSYVVHDRSYATTTKPGLGATLFTIGFQLADDNSSQSYSSATGQGGTTYKATMEAVLKVIASYDLSQNNHRHYYPAEDEKTLSAAFTNIANNIIYAATDAYFMDQMSNSVSLQMTSTVNKRNESGAVVPTKLSGLDGGITPKIRVLNYNTYLAADVGTTIGGKLVTTEMVGERYGSPTEVEVVTFTDDGKGTLTGAYSNLIGNGNTNILKEGVIEAKNFWYNTTVADKTITLTNGTSYTLERETFRWNIGTIKELEWALEYYVYLKGSMEGNTEAGSYATNNYATLYYKNWLGNDAHKDTVSPQVGWKSANVSFAFYLVDEFGRPIVNQTTGQTGSFYDAVKVTRPVVYQEILLNNLDEIDTIEAKSLEVLPDGYELYDNAASYKVVILSEDGKGSWTITQSTAVQSTYVTGYQGAYASNETLVTSSQEKSGAAYAEHTDYDYTHTTVWFAVKWKVQALPDVVVVDYGLPVDIHVLTNDMFGENGKLAGIGAYSDSLNLNGHDTALDTGFGDSYRGEYGSAKKNDDGTVEYKLTSMQMDSYEKFAYAVNYTGNENAGYYYDTITVIPATTIYYEDSFLTFAGSNANGTTKDVLTTVPAGGMISGQWYTEGTLNAGAKQDEDRPGQYSVTDANNIYGYDAVNLGMSMHSLGQAAKVHVDANSYATATFTFMGTGFDVISMTSNTTGTIAVSVKDANGDSVANKFVNTYYGYKYENDEWIATPDVESALYQVPVLQIESLPYGEYTVTITATYAGALDKTTADGYDLYLDAIRIYDPANDGAGNKVIQDAYKADGEGWPSYIELRNKILKANSFDDVANIVMNPDIEGVVFIDGMDAVKDEQISNYLSYGPNNEIYLKPGQRIAFLLSDAKNANGESIVDHIHLGLKSADGKPASYTIVNVAQKDTVNEDGQKVLAGTYYNARTATVNTTTDMYYDITGWKNDIIIISNYTTDTGTAGILSLTNIKVTYTENPGANVVDKDEDGEVEEVMVYMSRGAATLTLRALNKMSSEGKQPEEEETQPEETKPEETKPEETKPEETKPEETQPEETQPEETQPEETKPEETQPEETQPEETQPEETQPEETQPEENEGGIMGWLKRIINTVMNWLSNLFR